MQLKLIVAKGEPQGKEIPVEKDAVIIGRDRDCDVVVLSTKVSRTHCRVEVRDSKARLVDLGSKNGTIVNRQKVAEVELGPGDRIAVGPLGLVVEIDGDRGKRATKRPGPDISDFLAKMGNGEEPPDLDDAIQLRK